MKRIQFAYQWLLVVVGATFALSGCNTTPQSVATPLPLPPTSTTAVEVPMQETAATTTATMMASPTEPSTATPPPTDVPATAATAVPIPGSENYLDDRSGPVVLMESWANALNRREYLRAYSYWEEDAAQLLSYEQFANGYAATAAVQLQTGTVYSGVGAGNTYYDVPLILRVQTRSSTTETYAGCYRLHLGSPAAQGALPFRPLAIQSADVTQVSNTVNPQELLAQQCLNENGEPTGQPLPAATAPAPDDISADRYLDDRSNAVQVLRSYFNAIHLHEYVRAYDYWQNQDALPALDDFITGYEETVSTQLFTGSEVSDAGAGQFYSQVPVVLVSQITSGATQTFAGCYTLHLANPTIQATPPFESWGIQAAEIQQVDNGSDVQQLLAQGCN